MRIQAAKLAAFFSLDQEVSMILTELFVLLTSLWVREKRGVVQQESMQPTPPSNSAWARSKKSCGMMQPA
jgi:hypothetical protein